MQAQQFQAVCPKSKVYSGTVNPASLADAAGATSTVTASGVVLGRDAVIGFAAGVDLAGITVTAYVSANDVISVRVQNESGGVVDLASSTWYFLVTRLA